MQVLTRVRMREMSGRQAIVASLIGAGLTAVCAQIAFYLPGNPIPVTMQVFAVVLCGLVLGSKAGALSQIEYLVAGLLGAPVFSGFTGGPASIAMPSWGYIVGFIAAAYIVGLMFESQPNRTFAGACAAGLAGVVTIYTFGAGWLAVWLRVADRAFSGWGAWMLGVAPFVGIDAVKVFAASALCTRRKH